MTTSSKKWEEVQKKAFTHWVNSLLTKREEEIANLQDGFSSGVELITLVEVLSGKKIDTKWTKKPSLKVHKINNCFIALQFLQNECQLKNVTVSAEDLVNGEHLNLILGFCWLLLRNFQEPPVAEGKQGSGFEENLLHWVKTELEEYKDLDFQNGFKSEAFTSGKAILALVNQISPGSIDYKAYAPTAKIENCQSAISLAQQHAKIPDIIDPEELANGKLEDKELVLYLSLFNNAFKNKQSSESKESLLKRLAELEEKFRALSSENEDLRKAKTTVHHLSEELSLKFDSLSTVKTEAVQKKSQVSTDLTHLKEKYSTERTELVCEVDKLTQEISTLKESSDSNVTQLQNSKDEASKARDEVREELKKTKDQLTKEKEELLTQKEDLTASLARNKKFREELEEIRKQQNENQQKTINVLRKHLLEHIKAMDVWKPQLESGREFKGGSELKLVCDSDLEKLPLTGQIEALDKALLVDNKKLQKLVDEKQAEAAEIVSVNIGKKKKRIKKLAPGEVAEQVAGAGKDKDEETEIPKSDRGEKKDGSKTKTKKKTARKE